MCANNTELINILGCQSKQFPIIYLEIPIFGKKKTQPMLEAHPAHRATPSQVLWEQFIIDQASELGSQ